MLASACTRSVPGFVTVDLFAVTGDRCSYMVTHLMGADLNNIVKTQRLSDDHVQFLVYQILRGLKACMPHTHTHVDTHMEIPVHNIEPKQKLPHLKC